MSPLFVIILVAIELSVTGIILISIENFSDIHFVISLKLLPFFNMLVLVSSAISGPAGKYLEAAGIEVSALGIAKMYAHVCSNFIIDTKDRAIGKKIEALNINVHDTKN